MRRESVRGSRRGLREYKRGLRMGEKRIGGRERSLKGERNEKRERKARRVRETREVRICSAMRTFLGARWERIFVECEGMSSFVFVKTVCECDGSSATPILFPTPSPEGGDEDK